MADALVLPLAGSLGGQALAAIRQISDERSRSDPHVTVRAPIRTLRGRSLQAALELRQPDLVIASAGRFVRPGEDRVVEYLRCDSETLESFNYKPEFPDSKFHLTLYEGRRTQFSERLGELLATYEWGLSADLPPDSRLSQVTIGGQSERGRASRFSLETIDLLADLGRPTSVDVLESLDDDGRLGLIEALCDYLHDCLPSVDPANPQASFTVLEPLVVNSESQLFLPGVDEPRQDSSDRLDPGLVLTPPELAEDMVRAALDGCDPGPIRFLDPAIGSGILFAVLTRLLGDDRSRLVDALGVELDRDRAEATYLKWLAWPIRMVAGNFLQMEADRRSNLILANPPYVRSQLIPSKLRSRLRERIGRQTGVLVGGRSNLYAYFLLGAHEWMEAGATACWLIPSDFLNSRHGSAVRDYLSQVVELRRMHIFDPRSRLFENADVSPVCVVFRKGAPSGEGSFLFSHGASMKSPDETTKVKLERLRGCDNWLREVKLPRAMRRSGDRSGSPHAEETRLGDHFVVRRGIATGRKGFFVLSEGQARANGIELEALRPILPSFRYLPPSGVVLPDEHGAPELDEFEYLIDRDESLEELSDSFPGLAAYLKAAPRDVLAAHLVRRRKPFYRQDVRGCARLVALTLGKNTPESSPVRFALNLSNATVLNNYVMLEPRNARGAIGERTYRSLLSLLRSADTEQFSFIGKHRSGGSIKVEGGALADVRLPCSGEALSELFGR